jgi:hypothetical protein
MTMLDQVRDDWRTALRQCFDFRTHTLLGVARRERRARDPFQIAAQSVSVIAVTDKTVASINVRC